MAKTIGIDLGTPLVHGVLEGEPTSIEKRGGGRHTPSVVAFTRGASALSAPSPTRQAVTRPPNTICSRSALHGPGRPRVREESNRALQRSSRSPTRLRRRGGRQYVPAALDQRDDPAELKDGCEASSGRASRAPITGHVVLQRRFSAGDKDAGTIAGLDVKRIITSRPRLLSRRLGQGVRNPDILVSTSRRHVRRVGARRSATACVEVKATAGDNHLGGRQLRQGDRDLLVAEFRRSQGIDSRRPDWRSTSVRAAESQDRSSDHAGDADQPAFHITSDASVPSHLDMRRPVAKLTELPARPARPHGRARSVRRSTTQGQGRL